MMRAKLKKSIECYPESIFFFLRIDNPNFKSKETKTDRFEMQRIKCNEICDAYLANIALYKFFFT